MRIYLLFMLGLLSSASWAHAQQIATLRISQTRTVLPEITVYLDVRDALERPAVDIHPEQITALVGADSAKVVSVQPFREAKEGIGYVFLVDKSKSLRRAQLNQMREALLGWVEAMEPVDRAAIITFGERVVLMQDFTGDKAQLRQIIEGFETTDNKTQLHLGLAKALELGRRTDEALPDRRAIVVLSDGMDDFPGGMMREEVMDRIHNSNMPIYAIGLFNPPRTEKKEEALRKLGSFARASGGKYFEAGQNPLSDVYETLREHIRDVWVVRLTCAACATDGSERPLRIGITAGGISMFDEANIHMYAGPVATNTGTSVPDGPFEFLLHYPWWVYTLAGLLLVGLATGSGVFIYRRRNRLNLGELPPIVQPIPPKKKPEGMPIRLTIVGGARSGEVYDVSLHDQIILGRSRGDCDVAFPDDEEASRKNSVLVKKDGGVYLRDLDSMNGTYVNGVPISGSYRLEDGDRILIGRTELRITLPGGATRR